MTMVGRGKEKETFRLAFTEEEGSDAVGVEDCVKRLCCLLLPVLLLQVVA
jgi:hypothetical protein